MRYAFYFMLKHFLFSGHLHFCSEGNGLIRKRRLISKVMKSQAGQQIIAIHTLLDTSTSKDNQNIFLQKSSKI